MNFVNGAIQFASKYKQDTYFPLGPPRRKFIGNHAILEPTPIVEFQESRYSTEDPEIAAGLLNDKTNFDREWGFSLIPSCLPLELREFWRFLTTNTRRKLCLALVEGASIETAFDLIPKDETKAFGTPLAADSSESYQLVCPKDRCKFVAKGDNAQQALRAHDIVAHGGALAGGA